MDSHESELSLFSMVELSPGSQHIRLPVYKCMPHAVYNFHSCELRWVAIHFTVVILQF